jgi:hypothetical protein
LIFNIYGGRIRDVGGLGTLKTDGTKTGIDAPDRCYCFKPLSIRQVFPTDPKHVEASPEKVTHHAKKGDPDKS